MIAVLAFLRRVPVEVWAGLLVLAMFAGWTWLAYDTGHDRAMVKSATEIAQLKAQVAELESANAAARSVIKQLSEINREIAEGRSVDQQAAAKAVASLRSDRDALRKELDRRRTDRGVLYERDPIAASWADTRVPDAIADSLRD